jgi:hypothetical protein
METPMIRKITVTSSSNEISTDDLGNKVVVRGGRRHSSGHPSPLCAWIFLYVIFTRWK